MPEVNPNQVNQPCVGDFSDIAEATIAMANHSRVALYELVRNIFPI
jgi:hypothetical protein